MTRPQEVGFTLLAADGARARAYLQMLCAAGYRPSELFLMPGSWAPPASLRKEECAAAGFDPAIPVGATAERFGVRITSLPTRDVNDGETVAAVSGCAPQVVILCAPAGQILRRQMLGTGKRFLHAHPGRVPDFRGSTTIYYSLLEERRCSVSAMFLNAEIDRGDVVLIEDHEPPVRINVDVLYDPAIRARTLVAAMRRIAAVGPVGEAQGTASAPYFVIHPVLKHIALLQSGCWA